MAQNIDVMNEIRSLTNKELFNKIQELGYDIGPVMKTTRKVYEKKLYKILCGAQVEDVGGDRSEVGGDDDDDDDCQESMNTVGSGDFSNSSRLFVEDSVEEEEEEDGGACAEEDEEEEDVSMVGELDWSRRQGKEGLYPKLDQLEEQMNDMEIDYFLKKYRADEEDVEDELDSSSSSHVVDTAELRRRPLHSVRESPMKHYPATFTSISSTTLKQRVGAGPRAQPSTDPSRPSKNPSNYGPPRDNPLEAPHSHTTNKHNFDNDVPKEWKDPGDSVVVADGKATWNTFLTIFLVALGIFVVLVFLFIEPEQELPKLDM